MQDFTKYKLGTLCKMRDKAEEKYIELTLRDSTTGVPMSKPPSLKAWNNARERVQAIKKEISKRV